MSQTDVQTILKSYISLASFNLFIRMALKLTVIPIFFPFSFYFLLNMFFLSLYPTNLKMIGLDFWPASLGFPIGCVRSMSASVIDNSRCSFITVTQKSSVFSLLFSEMPRNNKQLRLEHCFCFSTWPERLLALSC